MWKWLSLICPVIMIMPKASLTSILDVSVFLSSHTDGLMWLTTHIDHLKINKCVTIYVLWACCTERGTAVTLICLTNPIIMSLWLYMNIESSLLLNPINQIYFISCLPVKPTKDMICIRWRIYWPQSSLICTFGTEAKVSKLKFDQPVITWSYNISTQLDFRLFGSLQLLVLLML